MGRFHVNRQHRQGSRWWLLLLMIPVTFTAMIFAVIGWYRLNLQPLSGSQDEIIVTIPIGTTAPEIGTILERNEVIKSATAFDWYTRINNYNDDLHAGGYKFRQSQSVEEIVEQLMAGNIATDLVTILPGQTVDQIKMSLASYGYTSAEINSALDPENHADHPALSGKPAAASLDGYLYPESFQRSSDITLIQIISASLDEMSAVLTDDLKAKFSAQGLSVHEAVILASIVEREVGDHDISGKINDNRAKAAQVFLKRLKIGMMLQSNATDNFPAEYDTYSIAGLPPGPISNVSESSLHAVADPANTDYLYFVSGKDCITRFSQTIDEHEALKSQYGIAQPGDNCRG